MSTTLPDAPTRPAGWGRFFDELAPAYEDVAFGGAGLAAVSRRELDAVRGALVGLTPGAVLDAGAGTGRITRELGALEWSVTALDTSASMLAQLRASAPTARTVRATLDEPLAFRPETFDAVVCLRVLKYVADLDAVLAEFRRVLRPGGTLVAEFANRRSVARFGYRGAAVRTDTVREFDRALARAGFTVGVRWAGPRLPQPVWAATRRPGPARAAVAVDRAVTTVLGGRRSTTAARSVIVVGSRT